MSEARFSAGVLHGIERIKGVQPGTRSVVLCYGHKAADRLSEMGIIAACWIGWRETCRGFLRGHHVVMLPANDPVSAAYLGLISPQLIGVAASLRILVANYPANHGIYDQIEAGLNKDRLGGIVGRLPVISTIEQLERAVATAVPATRVPATRQRG